MRRESLGKDLERKPNMNPELSVQKCREEIALYNAQTEQYFEEERGLTRGGLNPKLAAEVACVTDADVELLFGKCTKFRTTNTVLNPDARKDLMELYSKIYGSQSVTNNEFAGWLVKGYIANLNKKKVNWALAASTTASEKADRAQRQLLRLLNPDSTDDATASGFRVSTCTSHRDGRNNRNSGAMVQQEGIHVKPVSPLSGLGFQSVCPYGVSSTDLDSIRDVMKVESDILVTASSKLSFLECEYKKISDKLVGFRFTMDDRHGIAKEDEDEVLQLQTLFEKATEAVSELEVQILLKLLFSL